MSERHDRIKTAAQEGYDAFTQTEEAKGFAPFKVKPKPKEGEDPQVITPFKDLSAFEKSGLYAQVAAIVANPLEEPYASLMPANHDRKEYRALDDCLRDALGYARFDHK